MNVHAVLSVSGFRQAYIIIVLYTKVAVVSSPAAHALSERKGFRSLRAWAAGDETRVIPWLYHSTI